MKTTDSNINYANARKRLEDLKGFYWSAIAYCLVIPFLITINYLTSWHEHKWFVYPMLGSEKTSILGELGKIEKCKNLCRKKKQKETVGSNKKKENYYGKV